MEKFNEKLELLEDEYKNYIENNEIDEYFLYELSRSFYNIVYDVDVFPQNGQICVGYVKENINNFKTSFKDFINKNNLNNGLIDKQFLFDIIIQTYKYTATNEEFKSNSSKGVKTKAGNVQIKNWDYQPDEFNSVPEELIEKIKIDLGVQN